MHTRNFFWIIICCIIMIQQTVRADVKTKPTSIVAAGAKLIEPIQLKNTSNLSYDFSAVDQNSNTNQSIKYNNTCTKNKTRIHSCIYPAKSAAHFTVMGKQHQYFSITLPDTVILKNAYGDIMLIDNLKSSKSFSSNQTGKSKFAVNANLDDLNLHKTGHYIGKYVTTIEMH